MPVVEAPVVFRDRNAILRVDSTAKVVSILSGADRTGKNEVVFRSNVSAVINVETSEERLARQHARARELSNNATLKAGESGAMAAGAQTEDDVGCFSRGGKRSRGESKPFMAPASGGAEGPVPAAVVAPQPFFLHYVVQQKKVHSITFFSRSGEEQLSLAKLAVDAILEEVYVGGQKQLVVFVSPVSGSGGAKKMWEREVLPILYLSKHAVTVITTTHQAHCEQYIADLANTLNGSHVIVAIGGDGMMHEAVNGLQRRRELQQEQRGNNDSEEDVPLLASVPAGSGCAFAKSFNVIEPIEAGLALVHLNTTTIDLMRITYVPCMHTFVPTADEIKEAKKQKLPVPVVRREMTTCSEPPRYAFLNVAFAITNEVDKGSEQWRWMGNARFTVKALQIVAAGIPLYRCRVRYLPWSNVATGERLEKTAVHHHLPKKTFAKCTGREACEHCQQHRVKRGRNDLPVETPVEEEWIDIPQDRFTLLMINNLIDAARDMAMAPLAHVGDGSMDIVYTGRLPTEPEAITRGEFIKVFLGLEAGTHIDEPTVHYVKAKEVEILVEDGLVMADGELLPTSGVRVRNLPQALRIVRSL